MDEFIRVDGTNRETQIQTLKFWKQSMLEKTKQENSKFKLKIFLEPARSMALTAVRASLNLIVGTNRPKNSKWQKFDQEN